MESVLIQNNKTITSNNTNHYHTVKLLLASSKFLMSNAPDQ